MNLRKYVIGLHAQIRRLASFKIAYMEWSNKTEWVQDSAHGSELGRHRADVILERINRLKAENESLRALLKQANVHVPCNWPLRSLINATLISSPENH